MKNLFNKNLYLKLVFHKKIFLLLFSGFLFISPNLIAQKKIKIGFHYGAGITGILKKNNEATLVFGAIGQGKYKPQSTFVLGLNSMMPITKNKKWHIGIDLSYNFFRTSLEKKSTAFGGINNTEFEYYKFDYFACPIKLIFNTNKIHYFIGTKYVYNFEAAVNSSIRSFARITFPINTSLIFNTRRNAEFESFHELKFLFGAGFNLSHKIRLSIEYSDYTLKNSIIGREFLGEQSLLHQTNSIIFFITHQF